MNDPLIIIGLAIVFLGIGFVIAGSLSGAKEQDVQAKFAVGGFFGPIPFGFFSDRRMIVPFLAMLLLFVVLYFLLQKYH